MSRNSLSVAFLLFIFITSVFGLSYNARNVLEFRAVEKDTGSGFFEDRLDLRLSISDLTLGVRFEAMQPSRESAITRPGSTYVAITQRWADFDHKVVRVTAGNFAVSMGGGLLIDARELRDIQQDHLLDGARVDFDIPFIDLTMFSGLARWDNDTRFRGGEIRSDRIPIAGSVSMPIGCGYVRYDPQGEGLAPDLLGETWEVGASPMVGPAEAEFHYAKTWRGPAGEGVEWNGDAIYGSGSLAFGPIILFGEFLDADSFLVYGYGDNISYVTLPLIVRQPSYTLLSRHLAEVNPRGVTGFSTELSLIQILGSDVTVSFANLDHYERAQDYYEIYGSFCREWEPFSAKLIYELQRYGDYDPTHNAVLEWLYYFGDRASLLLDFELQHGPEYGETVTNYYGMGEFSLSPYGSFGVEGGSLQEQASDNGDLESKFFGRVYIDGEIVENHRITLAYGKHPGGFTCSGGRCRPEPPFEGFELKLSSSF